MEVIEFPSVLIDLNTNSIVAEFQRFVKPLVHPQLSHFCTALTGITQQTVDAQGVSFAQALNAHSEWLKSFAPLDQIVFVTCGDWDLKTMLPGQCKVSAIAVPSHFASWCNLKFLFAKACNAKQPSKGMTAMLQHLGLPLVGRHHSGIDDCRNIAQILLKIITHHCAIKNTSTIAKDGKFKRLPL
jgi:inhibitor of KinA sporulation pathway (predicted exonuclease)